MRSILGFCLCLILSYTSFTPKAFATNWLKAETDHFIVYSNTNKRNTEAFITKLEQFRYVLNQFYIPRDEQALPATKLEIYFTNNRHDFRQIRPGLDEDIAGFVPTGCIEGVRGFSHFSGEGIVNGTKSYRQEENTSLTFMQHEFTHMFMAQNSSAAEPRWYTEGIAEYYGSMQIAADQMTLGYGSSWRVQSLQRSGQPIKYEDILRDDEKLHQDRFQEDFYAQSWLLTSFIMLDRVRQRNLAKYIEARNQGEDPIIAFETIFNVKVKDLKRLLGTHLHTAKVQNYPLTNLPHPTVKIAELPRSSEKLILWDAAVKSCAPRDYQPLLLAKIETEAAKFPNDQFAQDVLGRANIIIGPEEKALDHYKKLTLAQPNDHEAFFRLGQTYYLMAVHDKLIPGETKASQIAKARIAFGRAYQLDETNPTNLYYYSKTAVMNANFPDDSSLNAATESYMLASRTSEFAFNAATMLIFKGDLATAKVILTSLANDPHGGEPSQKLKSTISAIEAGKSKHEVLTTLGIVRELPNLTK